MSPVERLRTATRAVHRQLEAMPFALAMREGVVPLAGYRAFLHALHVVHLALEQALVTTGRPDVDRAAARGARRRARLEDDLARLAADATTVDASSLRALLLAGEIRLAALRDPAQLFGWVYVLEGSQLGGLVSSRALADRADLRGGGLAYLTGAGAGTRREIDRALAWIERALPDEDAVQSAVAGAIAAFDGFVALFEALDPARGPERWPVGELNRDAGDHPIPDDLREVAVALDAGEASWRDWAYFEARYGERGRRFTRSDSAWLVTLARLDATVARRHVLWLGRVLACRGMPRVLLECHLESLHERLVARFPEHARRYRVLQRCAALLRAERTTALGERQATALLAAFATERRCEHGIAPLEAGRLLLAAVADERCGIESAVASLVSWLADAERFSAGWVVGVREFVDRARTAP